MSEARQDIETCLHQGSNQFIFDKQGLVVAKQIDVLILTGLVRSRCVQSVAQN